MTYLKFFHTNLVRIEMRILYRALAHSLKLVDMAHFQSHNRMQFVPYNLDLPSPLGFVAIPAL